MAEGLLNAFWRGLLSQTANATTEISTNENEVCRRLILSGITVSATGVITIPGLTIGTIVVAGGGTGQVTLLNHGVLIGQGTSAVASAAVGTTGQVLTGVTGADPTFQTPAVPVTSVALTVPAEFTVAGSPVTTTGTLAVSKATQAANLVYAGPTSGGVVAPTFRAVVVADLPTVDVPHGGTGVATLAAHGVVVGNGTGVVAVTGAGTAGQLFTSNGASADPTFQTIGVLDRQTPLITNGNVASNTSAETAVYTFSVPGNTLGTTKTLHCSLIGDLLQNSGASDKTYSLKVKYGATTIFTAVQTNTITGANRGAIVLDVELTAAAATGAQRAKTTLALGNHNANNAGGTALTEADGTNNTTTYFSVHNAVAEDSTAAKNFVVTFTMSFPAVTMDMRAHTAYLELK